MKGNGDSNHSHSYTATLEYLTAMETQTPPLSCPRARQLYRKGSEHLPRHLVTLAVLQNMLYRTGSEHLPRHLVTLVVLQHTWHDGTICIKLHDVCV
jgi:hypothetical protein